MNISGPDDRAGSVVSVRTAGQQERCEPAGEPDA
jgi:hypothetical protein